MKSLIEEASSIAKAIEKAWERASRPASFSIKIFELPEKNFIGMTTKYAKVGLFFEDKKAELVAQQSTRKQSTSAPTAIARRPVTGPSSHKPRNQGQNSNKGFTKKAAPIDQQAEIKPAPIDNAVTAQTTALESSATWSEQMKVHLRTWLKEVLVLIGYPEVEFTCQQDKNLIKINFDAPLTGNELKESLLYKNISCLAMVSLRTHFKNEMKTLKILLSRE